MEGQRFSRDSEAGTGAHGVDLFSVNLLGHRQETSAQLEKLRLTQDSGIPTMSLMRAAEDTHVRACTLSPGFILALSTLGSEMCLQAITNASDTENGTGTRIEPMRPGPHMSAFLQRGAFKCFSRAELKDRGCRPHANSVVAKSQSDAEICWTSQHPDPSGLKSEGMLM